MTIEPRPVGGPLDVWIGGSSDLALKRVARYGDGWLPSFITPEEFADGMRKSPSAGRREIAPDEVSVLILTHVATARGGAGRRGAPLLLPSAFLPRVRRPERDQGVDECIERVQRRERRLYQVHAFPIAPAGEPCRNST
jgi:hypothetical protein